MISSLVSDLDDIIMTTLREFGWSFSYVENGLIATTETENIRFEYALASVTVVYKAERKTFTPIEDKKHVMKQYLVSINNLKWR